MPQLCSRRCCRHSRHLHRILRPIRIDAGAGSVTKVSSGAAPAAEALTLPIADPEPWEGVLVQFKNVSVQSSPSEDTYGEWELTDGTNTFWVDEKLYDASEDFMLGVGEEFASITGIMNYSYSKYKIAPRSKADLAK